jgi:TolB protein
LYDSPRDARVYLASADGTNIRPLSLPGGSSAAWSPDGSRIVYTRDGFLHLINVDGSGEQKLAPDDLKCFDARWSPDGRQIACQSGNSARARAVVVNVDGSGYTYLTPEGRASGKPAWSPDGRYLVLAVSSSGGWRLHITDPAATFLINIQHMNGDSSISWTK